MYMINLRQGGIDGNAFSETEKFFDLDQAKQLKQLSKDELILEVERKNILIVVHGFNWSIADVLSFYLTLEQQYQKKLAGCYDAIIGFIWPGGETKSDYYLPKQYARKAGIRFLDWVHQFNDANCTIDVMSHGKGSLVVYHSMQVGKKSALRNIFSIGAGIPQEILTNNIHLVRVLNQVEHIYVFYIANTRFSEVRPSEIGNQELSGYQELENLKEELAGINKVLLINLTGLISGYPGYTSLAVVSEFINDLLSGSQYSLLSSNKKME